MSTASVAPPTAVADASPARQRGAVRRPALILSVIVFLALAAGAGLYWVLVASHYEDTDDAYVGGRVISITSQIGGTVIAVGADENDTVAQGQALVRLDPADTRIELQQREAQLAQAVRETRAVYAANEVLKATLRERETALARARDDLQRRQSVRSTGAISEEEFRHAEQAVEAAATALDTAREQWRANEAVTAGAQVRNHPNVLAAAARLREAFLASRRNDIPAPVGGQIARRNVQVGQRVTPGTPLLALVPMENLWVDANFKEVQLEKMRIGQAVSVVADIYGSHFSYHGKVIGVGAGTGAAFALLPAQNATGNWIKVVQRVPVRIALDPQELRQHPLRVGLSVRATVDVRDSSGAVVAGHDAASPDNRTDVFEAADREADALVARIIAANLVGAAEGARAP